MRCSATPTSLSASAWGAPSTRTTRSGPSTWAGSRARPIRRPGLSAFSKRGDLFRSPRLPWRHSAAFPTVAETLRAFVFISRMPIRTAKRPWQPNARRRGSELRALLAHVKHPRPRAWPASAGFITSRAIGAFFPRATSRQRKSQVGGSATCRSGGSSSDRHGAVRAAAAALFLDRLVRQRSMDDLVQCFPLQPLAVEAPLSDFYASHGIA